MRQNQCGNNVYNIDIITNLGNINIIYKNTWWWQPVCSTKHIMVGNIYDYLGNIILFGLVTKRNLILFNKKDFIIYSVYLFILSLKDTKIQYNI